MKEIDANREAWSSLAADHYETFRRRLAAEEHRLNARILEELPVLAGKKVLHLQCNTGADTILLYRMGADATGVDLSPDNIFYARKLAAECGEDIRFLESDVMTIPEIHREEYDLVFTSEGVLGWLPDLAKWADTAARMLKTGGELYLFDSHPFFLMLDEEKLARGEYEVRYPYFSKEPDADDVIGGYASAPKRGKTSYFWMHPLSEIVNAVGGAGIRLEFLHEFPENFYNPGGHEPVGDTGLYVLPFNRGCFPSSFSLRAVKEAR